MKAERVLDIGGSANPVKGRTKSWEVKKYIILDKEVEKYYHKKWTKPNWTGDVNYPISHRGGFDIVFMLEVAEYLWRPFQAMKNVYSFLREARVAADTGAIAYLSFPLVYPWHEPREYDFLRYTRRGVEKLLAEAGFKHWEIIERVDRSGKLVEFYRADGMHPTKGENHNVYGYLCTCFK